MKNKYNFAALLALALIAASAFNTRMSAQALPGSIWYNGDRNHTNGLANERDDSLGFGLYNHVFDDFNVTDPTGWNVTSLYSNNYNNYIESGGTTTAVEWSIRQGITNGNGGTLIAGGTAGQGNFAFFFKDSGDFGFSEYTAQVLNLNIHLAPGTYFLNVTPVGNGFGRSFDSDTSGLNCVGRPCGNNGNAFFDSNGVHYQGPINTDFSMGVIGTVVPEPATVALLICGVGALLIALRRWRGLGKRGRVSGKILTL
jgi:hypothetical protein